ncbi:MAG: hypothetical protein JWQ10_2294 [Herbaspirillum sp.]|nr:hypothetical protein [Herbaspirillum sp.]
MKYGWQTSRYFFTGLITLEILVAAVLLYYLRDLLLSPEKISSAIGPQEGYYWTAAQYQLAFLRLENQAILYAGGHDNDIEKIKFRYAILQSKFRVLTYPAELTQFFKNVPEYATAIRSLQKMMLQLDDDVAKLEYDPAALIVLIAHMELNRQTVTTISNNTRETEIKQREKSFSDFYKKRRIIFISSLLLRLLFITAALLLLLTFRRYKEVIRQHHTALEAEHKATAAAKATIDAKNTFLAIVSHELRTPLQSITAAIDVLIHQTESKCNEKVRQRLESALLQLEAQMRDLTDYVRLESGRLELHKSQIIVREVMDRTINDTLPLALKKGLTIQHQYPTDDNIHISDPERISQILNNLLTNAIKYTAHGAISVRADNECRSDYDLLTIEVADTGSGIPADKICAVFEPFAQINRPSTRKHDGMGMGLAIVKGLTNLLGGEVNVSSSMNHGTVFRVIIPLERYAGTKYCEEVKTNITQHKTLRVLVVDDSDSARDAFSDLLSELRIESDVSRDGDDALEKLSSQHYDALLLDIEMPGKDGYMLAQELRKNAGPNQHLPIILVSAHTPDSAKLQQFNAYLVKPVRLHTLRSALLDAVNDEVKI